MKRCPKCGRSYEDYWQVCLEDGVHLLDMKTIHKSHEMGAFKSLSKREAEAEWHQMVSFFVTVSLFLSVIVCIIVVMFCGNPFSAIRYQGKINLIQTLIYNAGAVTGIVLTGIVLAVPIRILWWRQR